MIPTPISLYGLQGVNLFQLQEQVVTAPGKKELSRCLSPGLDTCVLEEEMFTIVLCPLDRMSSRKAHKRTKLHLALSISGSGC